LKTGWRIVIAAAILAAAFALVFFRRPLHRFPIVLGGSGSENAAERGLQPEGEQFPVAVGPR